MRVLVLGATNRPNDIDKAILRRLPKRYPLSLPSIQARRAVLSLMLTGVELADDFNLDEILERTQGYSGSDLKEVCRNAVMVGVREAIREGIKSGKGLEHVELRKVKTDDFFIDELQSDQFFDGEDLD